MKSCAIVTPKLGSNNSMTLRIRSRLSMVFNQCSWKAFLCLVFIVVKVIIIGPLLLKSEAADQFIQAFERISSDFHTLQSNSRDYNDCSMILWTKSHESKYEEIGNISVAALGSTSFNRSHPIKLLIHGFSDSPWTKWTREVKKAYLRKEETNVFSLDWRPLALAPWYTTAVKNARIAGRYGADFLKMLVDEYDLDWSDIHVIGASLGAHVAGQIGFNTNGKIGRITGLDPCGPLFHTAAPRLRLDPTDAQFVDVIHTAGKWVGNDELMGHVDFFPNLGRAPQPGCEDNESIDLSCSHFASWQMFAHSVNSDSSFWALKCKSEKQFKSGKCCHDPEASIAVMGDGVDFSTRGRHFLKTSYTSPMPSPEKSINCSHSFDN